MMEPEDRIDEAPEAAHTSVNEQEGPNAVEESAFSEACPAEGTLPAEDEAAEAAPEIPAEEAAPAAAPHPASSPADEQREPEDGEYRYKSGYTQRIYADAHYAPADESTVPPRYYTPPERPSKVNSEKPHSRKGRFLKLVALCLACALLGGLGGAALVGHLMERRLSALEEAGARPSVTIGAEISQTQGKAAPVSRNAIALSDIYELACQQVVGVTTEVTYQNFFGQTSTSAVSGSGFIISSDGYILTNYHVIEYADKRGCAITVMLHDGTRYEASIVGSEESSDIAVLKIEATGLSSVSFGDSDAICVGDEVHAVGNPLGELAFSMTNGHVSALDRAITTESAYDSINMFQIDAPVNSGNSGGPVYDAQGRVIGVVAAKYSSTGVEGLGFAIPINDAVRIARDLIDKGYVTGKAYLGVVYNDRFNATVAAYYNLPLGFCVKEVEAGSCAEKAGLQEGDIITRLGDTPIESLSDLRQAMKHYSAGDSAELEYYRGTESFTVEVVFDEAKPTK